MTQKTTTEYGTKLPDGTYDWDTFVGTPAFRKDYQDQYNKRLSSLGIAPQTLEFVKRKKTVSVTEPVPVDPDETTETSTILPVGTSEDPEA